MGCCGQKVGAVSSYDEYMRRKNKCKFCKFVRLLAILAALSFVLGYFLNKPREEAHGRVELIIPGEDSPRTDGDGDGKPTHAESASGYHSEKQGD